MAGTESEREYKYPYERESGPCPGSLRLEGRRQPLPLQLQPPPSSFRIYLLQSPPPLLLMRHRHRRRSCDGDGNGDGALLASRQHKGPRRKPRRRSGKAAQGATAAVSAATGRGFGFGFALFGIRFGLGLPVLLVLLPCLRPVAHGAAFAPASSFPIAAAVPQRHINPASPPPPPLATAASASTASNPRPSFQHFCMSSQPKPNPRPQRRLLRLLLAAASGPSHDGDSEHATPPESRQPPAGATAAVSPAATYASTTTTTAAANTNTDNTNPKDLLYQVQEQALVDRGAHEEAIMQRNVHPLQETAAGPSSAAAAAARADSKSDNGIISSSKKKTAGASKRPSGAGGGGFGGGGGGGAGGSADTARRYVPPRRRRRRRLHEAPPTVDVTPYSEAIRRDGVVRINSVLSRESAQKMREWVVDYRAEALHQVRRGAVTSRERFADVLLRHNRCDMTLPLGPEPVMDALYAVLCQSPVLPQVLRGAFRSTSADNDDDGGQGDDDPVLYELSTLISDPGSQRQVVHPDNPIIAVGSSAGAVVDDASGATTNASSVPVLLTCFVALQDVTADMGPTVYLPGTHTAEAHRQFFSSDITTKDRLLESSPKLLGLLKQGDCSLYDSRVLHCGSANRHPQQSRALFYMSFRNPRVANPGNPASIRPDLAAQQVTLSQLQDLLVEHWVTGGAATPPAATL